MLRNSRLVHHDFHRAIRRSAVGDRGLPDCCTITRRAVTGAPTIVGAAWTPPPSTLIYEGPCRVQLDSRTPGRLFVKGDEVITLHRYTIGLPWDIDQVIVDDVVEVTRSHDLVMVGRPLVVRDFIADTFLVRRTVLAEDHPNRP